MEPIFAIGHSTRPIDKFTALLKAHGVTLLCDVRTIAKSGHNPQFGGEALAASLKENGVGYRHLKALGGLRHPAKDSVNTGWENRAFRGYADYMRTEEFRKGVEELLALAQKERVAVMCAEGNPFRCHRLLLADFLTGRGVEVRHISGLKSAKPHALTPFARLEGGTPVYPASLRIDAVLGGSL